MLKKIILFLLLIDLWAPKTSFAKDRFPFQGQIDFRQKEFFLRLILDENSFFSIKVRPKNENDFLFVLNSDHWTTSFMTLSTVIDGNVKIEEMPEGRCSFTGQMASHYTQVNYKPIDEMVGNFLISDNTIFIQSLSFGTKIEGRGVIVLRTPLSLQLSIRLNEVAMEDFLWFWTRGQSISSNGYVSGEIKVNGSFDRVTLKGELSSYDGRVQDFTYDSIVVNAEGIYPIINLYNSTVTEANGFTFTIDGSLNLEEKNTFPQQIIALTKAPLVTEDPSKLEWTFKRIQKEHDKGKTELKYLLRKDSPGSIADPEQSDMLGIERSIGF